MKPAHHGSAEASGEAVGYLNVVSVLGKALFHKAGKHHVVFHEKHVKAGRPARKL